MIRCHWAEAHSLLTAYHDLEWGVQNRDRSHLYEFLILEGAQAGLSWLSVLTRRAAYREAFLGFDPDRVARWDATDVERLIGSTGLIKNRVKLRSAINNARAFLEVEAAYGGFDQYLDSLTQGRVIHHFNVDEAVPDNDETSKALSVDLRLRGFSFVGPTICYSYLQAVGWVMDHVTSCFRYQELT